MKFLTVLLIIISSILMNKSTVFAQSTQKPVLNHIAVYVNDLQKSTDFYKNVIGLELMEEPFKDGKHTWFDMGVQGQFHLISGAKKGLEQIKDRHICFSVASIEQFIANLDQNAINYTNWKGDSKIPTLRVDGVKQIYFQDPDGYWIEVNNDKQ